MSERGPENKEAPNSGETYPTKDRTKTVKDLGKTAIDGTKK